jgi:hypothetical protein
MLYRPVGLPMKSPLPLAAGAVLALVYLLANGSDARSSRAPGGDEATGAEAAANGVLAANAANARSVVSFRNEVAPVLAGSCATRSCHGGGSLPPVLGRHASAEKLRAALVGVASEERPTRTYIAPGAPEASYLLQKVDGHLVDAECVDHDCGSPMPMDNPSLSADARAKIRAWVAQGALDN